MRDIKYRALNSKKKWEYFDLKYLWNCAKKWLDINWDTVGEFSGYKDTDGTDIYENDIIEFEDVTGTEKRGIVLLEEYGVGEKITFKHCGWVVMTKGENTALPEVADKCKVIGDTYTSPDLYFKG